jgi:hypothetical protein
MTGRRIINERKIKSQETRGRLTARGRYHFPGSEMLALGNKTYVVELSMNLK